MNDLQYSEMLGIRRSDLWVLNKSPMHFMYHMTHPTEPTPALIFGQAMHKYLLEPDTFCDEFAIAPVVDRRTKAGKEQMAEFAELNTGKTIISIDDMERIGDMKKALLANDTVREILAEVQSVETAYQWTDAQTGEMCKVKADIITKETEGLSYIVDYKTTTSCSDGAFEKACRLYGYDFQAGMYTEGINISTLEDHGFIFIAQEKEAPYASRVYFCSDYFIDRGKKKFHELLDLYHSCKQSDRWEGYETSELYGEDW